MRLPWLGIRTHKSKKWDGGEVPLSKSTFGRMACYATGMSKDMKQKFNVVNITGNAFTDINADTLHIIEFDE